MNAKFENIFGSRDKEIMNTGVSVGDDIINSLICIFILTGQEMFCENLRNFKVS